MILLILAMILILYYTYGDLKELINIIQYDAITDHIVRLLMMDLIGIVVIMILMTKMKKLNNHEEEEKE